MPNAEDLGFELLPPDDEGVEPQADVDSAEAASLEDPLDGLDAGDDSPEPYGMTWIFDHRAGRFVRQGLGPAEAHGEDSLRQWLLMAAYTARYAHPNIYSDAFGREDPDAPIGELAGADSVASYEDRLREAWLVHDRVAAVDNFHAVFDPVEGVLEIERVDVVTDDDERITVRGITVEVGE